MQELFPRKRKDFFRKYRISIIKTTNVLRKDETIMKNKCSVTISDLQISVHTDYDQAYVDELAKTASAQMEELLRASRYYSKLDAALLLLLDLNDRNARLEAENAKMKREMESMKLDVEILRIENEKLTGDTADKTK